MKVLHALTYKTTLFDEIQNKYPSSRFIRTTTPEEFKRECSNCDALIINGSFYNQAIADILKKSAIKLRWIQAGSDGLDKFVKPGTPDGVIITNTSGTKGKTIAEHAMGLLIALYQKIHLLERLRTGKNWLQNRNNLRPLISSIEGRTLLLAGYGYIGKEIARKAKAFDAKVIAINRSGNGSGDADEIVSFVNLHKVLPKADVLVICMPYTKETQGLFGKTELALLKPSSLIINVARGELIDTDAMTEALSSGKLGGAGLDVIDPEPLPSNHPLWNLNNVIISPHVAAHGGPLYERLANLYKENIERFYHNKPLLNVVNLKEHQV